MSNHIDHAPDDFDEYAIFLDGLSNAEVIAAPSRKEFYLYCKRYDKNSLAAKVQLDEFLKNIGGAD